MPLLLGVDPLGKPVTLAEDDLCPGWQGFCHGLLEYRDHDYLSHFTVGNVEDFGRVEGFR